MGVFNLKCSITNKTIEDGDPVAVLLLIPKTFRGDHIMIYNDDKYDFATLPIFGTYDSYGGIENIEVSYGLTDLLYHCNEDINMDIAQNEAHINERMTRFQQMHIKRDMYDYLMSEAFEEQLIHHCYPDNINYYNQENISRNENTIKAIFESLCRYKRQIDDESKPKDISLSIGVQDFSKLNSESHYLLRKDNLNVPRCLEFYTHKREYVQFEGYFNPQFNDAFSKHAQIQHLGNVLATLGVKLVPTLYGSQENTADFLWDDIYARIPKTIDDEDE